MLAGDKQLLVASSLLDFAEYKKLVALCGLNMFHTLERLPPHEKVECFVRTMTASVPELDRRDYVIRDRLNHAINYAFAKGLVLFDCDRDLSSPEEKAVYEVPDWNSMWKKMEPNDVHVWPLWEKEVYLLLGELSSNFRVLLEERWRGHLGRERLRVAVVRRRPTLRSTAAWLPRTVRSARGRWRASTCSWSSRTSRRRGR